MKKGKNPYRPLPRTRAIQNQATSSLPGSTLTDGSLPLARVEGNTLNITIQLAKIVSFQLMNCYKQGVIFHKTCLYVNSPWATIR